MISGRTVFQVGAGLGLLLSSSGCSTLGTPERVFANPTSHFPTTWGGEARSAPEATPESAPAAVEPAPAPAPAPREVARPTHMAAPGASLVAVLPLDTVDAKIDGPTKKALEEAIRTTVGDELLKYGYTVFTGETTLRLIEQNGIDAAKACDATCALDAARELKATLFVSGAVTRTEGDLVAFVRMFDSRTGKQIASVQLEGETAKQIRREFNARVADFAQRALQALQ